MRNNMPITNTEHTFGHNIKLISVTDKEGVIISCNKAFVDICGFEEEELVGYSSCSKREGITAC